jgi:hypothetical protein
MAFTTWAALKTSILDAMADSLAGSPCTGEYEISTSSMSRKLKYRSYEELERLYNFASLQAAKESGMLEGLLAGIGGFKWAFYRK